MHTRPSITTYIDLMNTETDIIEAIQRYICNCVNGKDLLPSDQDIKLWFHRWEEIRDIEE